jgi:two-component system response regulator NreC
MTAAENIRVLLIDDHLLVRYGMKAMLAGLDGFECVADAETGREGIQLARFHQPDVVVLDIDLGKGINGFDVVYELNETLPDIKILMLTGNPKPEFFQKAVQLGCAGYLLKIDSDQELVNALQTVARGENYLSKSFTGDIFKLVQDNSSAATTDIIDLFTPRETSVAHLIRRGLTTDEIGLELNISPKTVRVHRSNLKRKCGCKTTNDLLLYLSSLDSLVS